MRTPLSRPLGLGRTSGPRDQRGAAEAGVSAWRSLGRLFRSSCILHARHYAPGTQGRVHSTRHRPSDWHARTATTT